MDGRMKIWHRYTVEYYSATKKKEILSLTTTQTEFEGIALNEITQTEKDKYCMISLTCAIWKSGIHRNREENGGCQGLGVGEMGRRW